MLFRNHFLRCVSVTFATVLTGALSLRAENLAVTGNLTISGDTDLRGPVSFGRLTEDTSAKGFNVDVSQEGHLYYNEVYTEGSYTHQQTWVEEGYYSLPYTSTWDGYDWVNHPYWIPDTVDENGAIITNGYYQDNWQWEWVTRSSTTESVWVSSGGHYDYTDVWNEGYYTSVPVQTYDAPQVRFSGTRSNTSWLWRNPSTTNSGSMRDLMTLSPGGLSFPAPDDATGASRALLTHASFEQSYASPQATGSYQSFGSKVGKNKIEVWDHLGHNSEDPNNAGGVYTVLENKSEGTLAPIGLTLSYSESSDGGSTMNTATTTITASSASFGGSVGVKGVLRVESAGDLSMGVYTNGPRP
jgi:hypothetical protein